MKNFKTTSNGFNYFFERELAPNEEFILQMPAVSPSKRSINDIGWAADDDIKIYSTISRFGDTDFWQEINSYDEINKTCAYLKFKNTSEAKKRHVAVRVIMC